MVFQSYALYPHMSVYENLRFGLLNQKTPKPEIDARIRRAAEILQISELLERRPSQLSGGQSQRVAIGRAIVKEPEAFLRLPPRPVAGRTLVLAASQSGMSSASVEAVHLALARGFPTLVITGDGKSRIAETNRRNPISSLSRRFLVGVNARRKYFIGVCPSA